MAKKNPRANDPLVRWTIVDAIETYNIERWGDGYFRINDRGNIEVTPTGNKPQPAESAAVPMPAIANGIPRIGAPANGAQIPSAPGAIDLKELVDEIVTRGIRLPLLLRFSDILRSRVEKLNLAFNAAIAECQYKGHYRGVYPIKVNQARTVVEEIIEFGRPFHYGLEAGSKPELLATMAMLEDDEALVICNGYKDDEYIQMALLASKLGRTVVLVAEKPSEIDHIQRVSQAIGVKPSIGIRARLSARGSGKWEQSGGDRSKFGLSAAEMVEAVEKLKRWKMLDCLKLVHFHLGSQISSIRSIKDALREGARFYVELYKLGATSMKYFDVGGGLGIDYDGSQTNFASSMNYSLQEYANDVVFVTQQVCEAAEVPQPDLVTESGRAVAAHHSVLIVDVLEVGEPTSYSPPGKLPAEAHPIARNLFETYETANRKNVIESFHDALAFKDEALLLFNLGHLSLEERVLCEKLFWAISNKILGIIRLLPEIPEELGGLEQTLSDTYFLNFSVFQSLPDSWAVDQLFPIAPIHRLHQEPTRRAVLADITCDSDGAIDSFIDVRDVKRSLELHPINSEPYYLGFFLVGAYQEILGDLHNLFGDTNVVHVALGHDGRYAIQEVHAGDTISEVLQYVNYSPKGLIQQLRKNVEAALRKGLMTLEESRQLMSTYQQGLEGYTYLERD